MIVMASDGRQSHAIPTLRSGRLVLRGLVRGCRRGRRSVGRSVVTAAASVGFEQRCSDRRASKWSISEAYWSSECTFPSRSELVRGVRRASVDLVGELRRAARTRQPVRPEQRCSALARPESVCSNRGMNPLNYVDERWFWRTFVALCVASRSSRCTRTATGCARPSGSTFRRGSSHT